MKGPRNLRRHHPDHPKMKISSNRRMRRLSKKLMEIGEEPLIKMAGLKSRGFCCGGHPSDWRY